MYLTIHKILCVLVLIQLVRNYNVDCHQHERKDIKFMWLCERLPGPVLTYKWTHLFVCYVFYVCDRCWNKLASDRSPWHLHPEKYIHYMAQVK